MANFKTVGQALALASTSLALGSVVALSSNISSAQAVTFTTSSLVNVSGSALLTNPPTQANPNPLNITIDFLEEVVSNNATTNNDFAFLRGTSAAVADIILTNIGAGTYSGTTTDPFILFSDGTTFRANAPFTVTSSLVGNINALSILPLTGTFFSAADDALGTGTLTANQIFGDGSFSITLQADVRRVTPEPTATIGLAALGLGAFFTNNLAKKKKASVNA
ncbi:hypothetical protein [Nostoc parmelioides]|uniref:PEP-CTERM sorting domain-containing protein n=1 Tax=Nostoc parmelioides FACHB-3921 TaxID=2692909 RepID=A0ABR8BNJ8_9NOSO|nr:hypothetical protein [Nostoc parmelioides]MBD2254528.1 hypothetical protein [Nostoc parmelioides FACHB-3921]